MVRYMIFLLWRSKHLWFNSWDKHCKPAYYSIFDRPYRLWGGASHLWRQRTASEESAFSYDGKFDYIIIDCPPSLNILTINAMVACNDLLIPIQSEYYALEGIAQLLKTIRLIKRKLNPDLSIFGIVITMYDRRTILAEQVAKRGSTIF